MLYQIDFEMRPVYINYAKTPDWKKDVKEYIQVAMKYVKELDFYDLFDTQVQYLSCEYDPDTLDGTVSFYVEGKVTDEQKDDFVRYLNENFFYFLDILEGRDISWRGAGHIETNFHNFHYVAGAHC